MLKYYLTLFLKENVFKMFCLLCLRVYFLRANNSNFIRKCNTYAKHNFVKFAIELNVNTCQNLKLSVARTCLNNSSLAATVQLFITLVQTNSLAFQDKLISFTLLIHTYTSIVFYNSTVG